MAQSSRHSADLNGHAHEFATTHWSLVLLAGGSQSEDSRLALESLCRSYWYPLYAYVRRHGYSSEDAQDLTQEFFARLLERRYFQRADPDRGRFRTFLLCSLKNFLVSEWKKSRAQKRGGARALLSIDEQDPEGRYLSEPVDGLTPERIYEKRWAVTLLERVMAQLRERYSVEMKSDLFEALSPHFWADEAQCGYAEMTARLQMNEGALRVAMHRMRDAFRKALRAEVSKTVEHPHEVEEEIRYLVAVLRA
jgi:RNA polymerase sigma factor (sigma-70 family)